MSECQACVFQKCLILLRNSIVILQSLNKRVLIRMFVPTAGCRKRTSSLERAVSSQLERKREPTTSCFLREQPGGATPERLPCPSLWFAAAPHLFTAQLILFYCPTRPRTHHSGYLSLTSTHWPIGFRHGRVQADRAG